MRVFPTCSSLQLADTCPGAVALPRVGHEIVPARVGNAKHEHLHQRVMMHIDDAMAAIPEVCARWHLTEDEADKVSAQMRNFSFMPPRGALGEIGLCILRDGKVVRLRRNQGGRGSYQELPEGAMLPGTLDLMWAEPFPLECRSAEDVRCPPGSTLWVIDFKAGQDKYVSAIETNHQLDALAMMAARWTGATNVVKGVVFVSKDDGEWDTAPLGPEELESIWQYRLRQDVLFEEQRRRFKAGEHLSLVTGPQCEFCDSETRCPAKTAMIKTVIDKPAPVGDAPLTVDELTKLAWLVPQVDRWVVAAREALKAGVRVLDQQLTLPNGKLYGSYKATEKTILTDVAREVLEEVLGPEFAAEAIRTKVTGEAIKAAVANYCAAKGIKRGAAPIVRRIYGKIGGAGGLVTVETTRCGVHSPNEKDEEELG